MELNSAPDKPTIVMLHGFRGSGDGLLDTATLLPEFRVLVPNLPGVAGSQALVCAHTVTNFCTWLDEFLRVTRSGEFSLWGHSYGGALALAHAATGKRQATATVSVAPALPSGGLLNLIPACYFAVGRLLPLPLKRLWIASRIVNWVSGQFLLRTRDHARRTDLIERAQESLGTLDPEAVIDQYLSSRHRRVASYTDGIDSPVLLVGGEYDALTPPETLRSLGSGIPGSRVVVLSNNGHLAPLEDPESIARLTREFVLSFSVGSAPPEHR
jgi:pimeloyl-ACP methyl ester carboxylesterase